MTLKSNKTSIKRARQNSKKLIESSQTFADIYEIIFSQQGVCAEDFCEGKIREYTYFDVKNLIEKAALGIAQITGQKDKFIALCCPNRYEWLVMFWAILKSGNKPYLVNLTQSAQFSDFAIKNLGIEYVLSFDECNNYSAKNVTYNDIMQTSGESVSLEFGNQIALSSSGTSLNQKVCIYSGKEISAQILNSEELYLRNTDFARTYKGKQKVLALLPLYHIFGLITTHLWFAFWGAIMVFPENLVPATLVDCTKRHKVTHIFAVPVFWSNLEKGINNKISQLSEKKANRIEYAKLVSMDVQNVCPSLGICFSKCIFSSLRKNLLGNSVQFCISGGSFISRQTLETLNAVGYRLFNGYGMTEIGIASVDFSRKIKNRTEPTIGTPFSSVEYSVSCDGELLVRGKTVCREIYVNGTKTIINDEWFNTGDLVQIDEDGKYCIIGRNTDTVIGTNGENINPHFVEKSLEIDFAKDFCVVGDKTKENLVLVLQLPELSQQERMQIYEHASEVIKSSPYPFKSITYTVNPLVESGDIKISHQKIRNRIAKGDIFELANADEQGTESYDSETKIEIKKMIASVLDIPEEKVTDNGHFMNDLGGTSLDYMTVIYEIEETFGVRIDVEGESSNYSLNDLARKVDELISHDI